MKTPIFTLLFYCFFFSHSYAQDVNKLVYGRVIKKGFIKLEDESRVRFYGLILTDQKVTFTDALGNHKESEISQIGLILKTHNNALKGAIYGAAFGVIGGTLVLAGTPRNIDGLDIGAPSATDYVRVGALCGLTLGVIGGLLGLLFSSEKVIYQNSEVLKPKLKLTLNLQSETLNKKEIYSALSMKIKF